MTKKIIWRLKEQPTSEILRELVKDNILTKDEAREILFNLQEESERDNESFKQEIKFLRELVEKLSERQKVVTTIREIEVPIYRQYPWWKPYEIWCGGTTWTYNASNDSSGMMGSITSQNFSDIKTF